MIEDWPDGVLDDTECADVCDHGVGFDETCELCEDEIAEQRAAERAANQRQGREVEKPVEVTV